MNIMPIFSKPFIKQFVYSKHGNYHSSVIYILNMVNVIASV